MPGHGQAHLLGVKRFYRQFTPIEFIYNTYGSGGSNTLKAHWPLNETSWTSNAKGAITDVLGASNGVDDYAYWNTGVPTTGPVSGAGLGALGGTCTEFWDNSVTYDEQTFIQLGKVDARSWTSGTYVWLAIQIANPYWNWNNAFVAQNIIRGGAGTQLASIYDNNASADTLIYYGATIDTVDNLKGKFMTMTHTSDGTNSCMIVDGTIVKQGANSFSIVGDQRPACWMINGHNTPAGYYNKIRFQHVMLFDSILTPTQVLEMHNRARGA